MCGIAGVLVRGDRAVLAALGAAGKASVPDPHGLFGAVRDMAETLGHRGPDGSAAWVCPTGRCGLAHTRLKVIDLETGDQPMGNEDGSVQVVFNGEIYNFLELRRELEQAGHSFRTDSDTEVLVHGWEEWGKGLPDRLDGMFAFGIWDATAGSLFLARDRAGKKPLFLYEDEGRIAFGSEMKAILALPGVDDVLDPRAIPLYLAYGYVPSPGTFYRRVQKVPPATWIHFGPDGERTRDRFWTLDFSPISISWEGAVEGLRELLTRAVEKRLLSDVPLGAFLSGGVDSTIVVGLMSRLTGQAVKTFSIGMAGDRSYDETHFAEMAARAFGTDHTSFTIGAEEVDLLDDLLNAYDEPFGDSSALPTYIVSRLTQEEVTVALTGDGGDEIFAGYPRFLGMVLAHRTPGWMARVGNGLARALPHNPDFRSPSRRAKRFFAAAALTPHERMLRWIGFFSDELETLLAPSVAQSLTREELTRSFREPLEGMAHLSPLARTLAMNFRTYLLDDLLVKADRNSMAHGLELRSPFLDTELMEFSAALPDHMKIRRGRLKLILKEAFRDMLPPEVRTRKKMGFGIPLPTWLRTHWRPLVGERIQDPHSPLWSWIRPGPVKTLVDQHLSGAADHGHQIWALLTLDGWLRRGRFSLPS